FSSSEWLGIRNFENVFAIPQAGNSGTTVRAVLSATRRSKLCTRMHLCALECTEMCRKIHNRWSCSTARNRWDCGRVRRSPRQSRCTLFFKEASLLASSSLGLESADIVESARWSQDAIEIMEYL